MLVKTPIRMLGEIAFRVNDLEAMVDFYENVVGLELMRRESTFAFFRIGDGFAGHTQVLALFDRSRIQGEVDSAEQAYIPPDSARSTVDHIAFTIAKEDFSTEDQRLKELGVSISYSYHDWVQWRSLYIRDPDGNTVEWVCFDPQDSSS